MRLLVLLMLWDRPIRNYGGYAPVKHAPDDVSLSLDALDRFGMEARAQRRCRECEARLARLRALVVEHELYRAALERIAGLHKGARTITCASIAQYVLSAESDGKTAEEWSATLADGFGLGDEA